MIFENLKKSLGDKRKRLGEGTDGSGNEPDGLPNHIAVITRLYADLTLDLPLKTALLVPGGLGEKDPSAEICRDKKSNPEPDADLRDAENVPLPEGIALPLPLDYESKKNKGKVDVEPLLKLVRAHCEAYLKAEVLPYRPDAWIEHSKIKVGYEIIPFNRHFYEYKPPRPLNAIEADIEKLESKIMAMLKEITA